MYAVRSYFIEIRGAVEADDINLMSPLHVKVIRVAANTTLLAAWTDQAGFVGLVRHLHSLGFVLLAMRCEPCSLEDA